MLYSYSYKQVCCEQCLSRRNGSTIAIARFCRLSASNSLIKFASSGFKTKKHPFFRMSVFSFMVGPERIELSRHCCHQILSLARLPIPPQPHKNYTTLIYHIFSSVKTFFAFFINIFALHLFVAVLYSLPVDKKLRLQWKI